MATLHLLILSSTARGEKITDCHSTSSHSSILNMNIIVMMTIYLQMLQTEGEF